MICTAYAFLSPLRAPILFTLATRGSQKWKPGETGDACQFLTENRVELNIASI